MNRDGNFDLGKLMIPVAGVCPITRQWVGGFILAIITVQRGHITSIYRIYIGYTYLPNLTQPRVNYLPRYSRSL